MQDNGKAQGANAAGTFADEDARAAHEAKRKAIHEARVKARHDAEQKLADEQVLEGSSKPAPTAKPARPVAIKPAATRTRGRRRHFVLLASLLLMVGVPTLGAAWYLFGIASDQYHSTVGFSVRKEEVNSPVEILGGITSLSGSTSSDTDILYEYIQSQEMVETVDAQLDLRVMYSRPDNDPYFAFDPAGNTEDLLEYWNRMVKIHYDSGTGLIELRVLAFTPDDAQTIAQAVFAQSSRMINEISAIARDDATRYARAELDRAVERLKTARQAITEYRQRTQIVDPTADIQGQMGLLNTLQAQLAEALIELDLLQETTRQSDPRISQAQRRIEVITDRIEQERKKLGVGTGVDEGGRDYATLFSEYERLSVDREFAEQAYTASLSAYDAAQSEAQRQSRYLAAYVKPTLAQSSKFPQRGLLVALMALFTFLGWAIVTLVFYSIRDRR